MGLFLFWKLPAAWFMGVGLRSCDQVRSVASLPYRWRSQNPFQSLYFAAQCAAGEFATGMLGTTHLQGKPPISMLVTHIEAAFLKKAADTLLFTCEEGREVEAVIEKALASGEGQTITMTAVGTLPDGTVASRVSVTWSFKKKR